MTSIDGPPEYEHGTGFLLSRLGALAARSWAAFLAAHGLTQSQYTVLVVLGEQGPQGQRRLAQLIAVDARNIVAVLDALADRGLIERRSDPEDRRRRIVALTADGVALVDTLAAAATVRQDDFLRALDGRDRRRLNDLLGRLYDAHVPPRGLRSDVVTSDQTS
ncbi:MarR family winged helix-turn-helix transcriptional regulator [Microtetraspora glauca]|uniref:MarR family transcriptional regulator n=1 Tax=Microtetraspora glauca TaxID=1996 RepID=A0ABV3GH76_MICGL